MMRSCFRLWVGNVEGDHDAGLSPAGIERTGTLVPVRGTIVPFGDFAGTVPAVPAVGITRGLTSKKGLR
jgi:hypothetical protein